MKRAFLPFVLFGFALFASACGGGSGGGSSPLPHTAGGAASKNAGATVHVLIPKSSASSSSARKPAFIAPNTASISIGVYTVNGATPSPLPTPLSITIATSPDCTSTPSGTSCTITVTVPVATTVVLQLSTFDATGSLLGQGLIGPMNTTLATIPPQSVSVGGVPASLTISPAGLSAGEDGLAHPIPFSVVALDASGNTIIPPGTYPNPIALSISGDTNSALSLAATSIASPGPSGGASTVTLLYNSSIPITTATVTATYGSITASVPFAPIVFTPTSAPLLQGGSMQPVTVSEAGYAGVFTVQGTSSVATVTCIPSNCTPSSAGASVTLDIAPGSTLGTEAVSVVDANGGFANIPVSLTGPTGGGGTLVGPAYTVEEYKTTSGGTNYGITVGPDGQSLWYVDQTHASLGAVSNPAGCTTSCSATEYPIPGTSPPPTDLLSITAASDGNLYVTDVGNGGSPDWGNLFQASCTPSPASCTGTSYPYYDFLDNNPSNLTDVVAGPDGNLYISGSSDCCDYSGIAWEPIAGFSGYTFEIQVTGSPSAIDMMTFDNTGQTLWFTDQGNANVGFVTNLPCVASCPVIEWPSGAGAGGCGPQCDLARRPRAHRRLSPAAGPRPALSPRRRRNVIAGPGQTVFTAPAGIVAAPDGNIYVADPGAGVIDQISPSTWQSCAGETCTFTAIGLPNAGATPQNLTIGRDGNVWFTDTTGYVGFIALNTCASGTCKAFEYRAPNGGAPWGITSGPDGNIWFTDSSTNAIGKVVL